MTKIYKTKKQFSRFSNKFQSTHSMPGGYGVGQPFYEENNLIAIRWQIMNFDVENQTAKNLGFCSALMDYRGIDKIKGFTVLTITHLEADQILQIYFSAYAGEPNHFNLDILQGAIDRVDDVIVVLYENQDIVKTENPIDWIDASCRLSMISHLAFKPNEIELDLDRTFNLLPILCYMSDGGVMTPKKWNQKLLYGNVASYPVCIDKFPPMWWGTPILGGIRIADTSRVRIGAHLSPGTTVMHEGFVNLNAGTLGASMIEGRLSQGVTMDEGSDLGGSFSVAGTLSGGGKKRVNIGKNSLGGANGGTGISLGDRCTIEAGLYVTPGMIITIKHKQFGFDLNSEIKAVQLSGKDDMLFMRNSKTGKVIVKLNENPNKLNSVLHS